VKSAYEQFRTLNEGKNADYIPALAKVPSNYFGTALVTPKGQTVTAGDVQPQFSIQSISKVFTMAQVFQESGEPVIENGKLTPEAREKVLKTNYVRLFDAARGRVRAWEHVNVH
jgi:glutaminase